MLNQAKPLLLQAAFFGALYKGAQVLRKFVQTPMHPLVAARPELVVYEGGGLADSLTQLAMVEHPVAMQAILNKVCALVAHASSKDLKAQSHISNLIAEIVHDSKYMLGCVNVSSSDELFRKVQTCREEVLPLLEAQLDDILHNHLLDRAPRMG